MTINISIQDVDQNLHPKITVLGVGGSGGNAVNNMITANLEGVDFLIANTDAQALQISSCSNKIQLGLNSTKGLGAGMRPDIGKQAAEEAIEDLNDKLDGSHMLFIAAGMGGGTGTGAAPVIAKLAREKGILTVGVVTKPFHFEGSKRMKLAEEGVKELQQHVDTLLIIPNQNLFRIANEKTTFSDAFKMADDVLYCGVRGVTDLMVQPGMINLDFSDIKTVMSEMRKAMMGTGEASGEGRAIAAAEAAIANPLIDDVSLKGAKGLIINIMGGKDITLYEVDEAANRIRQEVDEDANIIYGTTCDERLEGSVRVSIVATGIDANINSSIATMENYVPLNINNEIYKDEKIEKKIDEDFNIPSAIEDPIDEKIHKDSNNLATDLIMEEKIEDVSMSFIQNTQEDEAHLNFDENNVNENLENISEMKDNEIHQEIKEKININKDNINETSVRKLSLFDTLSSENLQKTEQKDEILEKSEPVIASENEKNIKSETKEDNDLSENSEKEFIPEESENSDIDEEFNQETEEELLDIPTFLRRQAN